MATVTLRSVKGAALTFAEGDANFTNLNNDKLELTDLSVSADAAAGGGSLSYNNTTGEFTFAPASIPSDNTELTNGAGYITSYTETDPVVGAVNGLVKADGAGNISAAGPGIDYVASETVTTLSIAANTLSYVDENGTTTDIDLSLYIDDTNLARLTSGSLDANTGIATFTRDDATTFDIDFSALLNVTLADLSVTENAASGGGSLTYSNINGVFTYTPPDLSIVVDSLSALTDVTVSAPPTDGNVLQFDSGSGQWIDSAITQATGNELENLVEDTTPQLGGALDGAGNTVSDIELKNYKENVYALTYGATLTPDVANGNVQTVTLTGNVTINGFSNAEAGQSLTIILTQDGTGSRTLTTTMKMAGGDATLSTDANAIDILGIFYDGTNYYGSLSTAFATPS